MDSSGHTLGLRAGVDRAPPDLSPRTAAPATLHQPGCSPPFAALCRSPCVRPKAFLVLPSRLHLEPQLVQPYSPQQPWAPSPGCFLPIEHPDAHLLPVPSQGGPSLTPSPQAPTPRVPACTQSPSCTLSCPGPALPVPGLHRPLHPVSAFQCHDLRTFLGPGFYSQASLPL